MSAFDVIGFDADDTLWHSEDGFRANEERFVELIAPYAPDGIDVKAALTATERKNLATFGYGVKSFGLSMVEAAVTISGGAVPSTVVAEMVEMVRAQLEEPVRLLEHVPEVLAEVGAARRLILITKGDLIHQTHKVDDQRAGPSLRARRDRAGEGLRRRTPACCRKLEHRPDPLLHGRQQRAQRHPAGAWRSAATACTSLPAPVGAGAGRARRARSSS